MDGSWTGLKARNKKWNCITENIHLQANRTNNLLDIKDIKRDREEFSLSTCRLNTIVKRKPNPD